jgi:PAS domain-containing protein
MSPDWSEMLYLSGGTFAVTEQPNPDWLEEYIPPEDQAHLLSVAREAIRKKSLFELEHRMVRADGSIGWTISRAIPILDANGEIVEWFGTEKDVTERKQAEDALRKSEDRLHALVMASSDAVYQISPDWSEMLYLSGGTFEVTEQPNPNWLEEYIPPEDQAHLLSIARESIRRKSMFELEHRMVRADGSIGWTISRAIPILDGNGEIVEWFGTEKDVTERKLTEKRQQELLERERRSRVFSSRQSCRPEFLRRLRIIRWGLLIDQPSRRLR